MHMLVNDIFLLHNTEEKILSADENIEMLIECSEIVGKKCAERRYVPCINGKVHG